MVSFKVRTYHFSATIYRPCIAAAPVFLPGWQPQNYNATEGDDYIFYCKADAEPAAEMQWMIDGEPIDREWNLV